MSYKTAKERLKMPKTKSNKRVLKTLRIEQDQAHKLNNLHIKYINTTKETISQNKIIVAIISNFLSLNDDKAIKILMDTMGEQ